MLNVFLLLSFAGLVIHAPPASAQMDPSTALLLRRPSAEPPIDTLDEDHYSVRRARPAPRPAPAIIITPAPVAPAPPVPTARLAPIPRTPASEEPTESNFAEDALVVRVAAGYLNLDANSSNAFRDYAGGGAAVDLGITLWATPTFGIKADYLSSVAAHVRNRGANFGLDHQQIDLALMHRLNWNTTLVDVSVGYYQSSNRITRASRSPLGSNSRGVDLGLGLTLPQSEFYAHTAELHLHPFLGHAEMGVRDEASSGASNTSYGASASIGGQFAAEHDRDLFWRLRYTFEQNAFARGSTVTSGQAMLILGVQWGS